MGCLYGVVGFAYEKAGYNYLAFYLGVSGAFYFAPVLLSPILRLSKTINLARWPIYLLSGIAVNFGFLTTIFML